jgi:hypothetical protein
LTALINVRSSIIRIGFKTAIPSSIIAIIIICTSMGISVIWLWCISFSGSPVGRLLPSNVHLLWALLARIVRDWGRFEVLVCRIGWVIIFSSVGIIVRVVKYDVWRQSFNNPLMLQAFIRS